MGECAVRAGDWKRALSPLRDAMRCPGTHGNPWFHLRYGMTRLELADAGGAEHLARALRTGSRAIFDGLDAKYLAAAEGVA